MVWSMSETERQTDLRVRIERATLRRARERAELEGRSLRWIVERLLAGYVAGTPVPEVARSVVAGRSGLTPADPDLGT